jgi:predicted nucleic acid-binding protein
VIILDTSFLVAYHNERDVHHIAARGIMSRFLAGEWGDGWLLEYVYLEVVTVLQIRVDLPTAVRVGEQLLGARDLEFHACSPMFLATLDSFKHQPSGSGPKGLSFVDAAIVTAARWNPPGYVATFDAALGGSDGVTVVGSD